MERRTDLIHDRTYGSKTSCIPHHASMDFTLITDC
jgi:hypothetical protein